MRARKLNAPHSRLCDFDGPGHNKIIPANREATQIIEGEAQGLYHGAQCYEAALRKYRALKSQMGMKSENE